MATARLVASSYATSNSSYATVYSGETNMYNNTSNTSNYAQLRGRNRNSTTAYYIFIKGFNFNSIPANANVSSFKVLIRCYRNSYQRTGDNYRLRLASTTNFNNVIANTTTSTEISTSASVIEIPTGNLTWSTLSGYGANFSIVVPLSSTSSSRPYIYVYGVEIEVTYTTEHVAVTGVDIPNTASVEVGSTTQLTATISPSNATNQNVSWSSGNTSVATVASDGTITGVSAGTAVITVTTEDGNYIDTCTVTVAAAITYTYKLATTMVVGKKYLIANGNTGSVYLLTNESGGSRQLVGMSVIVSDGRISLTSAQKAKAEFECVRYTSGNDNTITVKSNNQYLFTNNANGLVMNSPATLDRFWHYQNNKFWQFKSTIDNGYTDTSSEYKYYLELNNSNNYTDNHVTNPSIADSSLPLIYIFVEDDGSGNESGLYVKINGAWTEYSKVYKKINGSWVEQADSTWATLFNINTNYRKMN